MAANPRRRTAVLDAALTVLGRDGGRALTHRAVDERAGVPVGTTANYFRRRADLVLAMAGWLFERLAPDPDRLVALGQVEADGATAAYATYAVERLLAQRDLALALVELRLEAARNPEVAAVLTPFLREGFAADVAFHRERGLPGGETTVLGLHHLVNGVVLDRLTVPLDPGADPRETAALLAAALVR